MTLHEDLILTNGKPGNRLIDLKGKSFGHLQVVAFAGFRLRDSGSKSYYWLCRCDCGSESHIDGCCLRRGSATDCGCRRGDWSITHGMAESQEYQVWLAMKQRCLNPNSPCYDSYGDRGITICDRWRESFQAFFDDMGLRPFDAATIERVDNDGNYEPANCRWATRSEQNENTRQTRLLEFRGMSMSLGKWVRYTGISRKVLRRRLDIHGWSVARALSTPPKCRPRRALITRKSNG